MQLSLASDEFRRLTCLITNGQEKGIATSSDPASATALLNAIDNAEASGSADCFWPEAGGEYRWAFRRDGDRMRIALMWSTGTMTGWEHVFWGECGLAEFRTLVSREVEQFGAAAADA